MNDPRRLPRRAWLWFLLPLIASAWTRDWWAPDEPRYAEVAREIYASGDFLVMHLCGEIYKNKPPLLFWLSGFLGSIAHWSELAMRVPSLGATLVSAWLCARLARRFWGEDEARLAPILYLTSAMVLWHGARMQIDPLLGALCLGALVLLSEPFTSAQARGRALVGAGLLTGLGVLAKGPIALLLVGVPLGGWRWMLGPHAIRVSLAARLSAVLAALAPGLAWALAVVAREPELAYDLFVGQFFERAVAGKNHINPFWYHLWLQPAMMLPWTVPMFGGSLLAWRALKARWKRADFDAGAAQAGWWFWSLMLAFSLSPEKRDLYLLPAYPAAALLGARWIMQACRERASARPLQSLAPILLAVVGVGLCCAELFAQRLPADFRALTWQPFAVGAPLAIGAILALLSELRREPLRAANFQAVGLALSAAAAALAIFPLINPAKSTRSMSSYLASRAERPSRLACIGVMPEGFRFYSALPAVSLEKSGDTVEAVHAAEEQRVLELAQAEGAQFLALVARENWERWSAATRARFEVAHAQSVGRKDVVVLTARP